MKLYTFFFLNFLFFTNTAISQVGFEAAYIYGPKKESFGGRLYIGSDGGYFRVGLGGEIGKFNSKPTDRVLDYYSIKAGVDYCPFEWEVNIFPYFGLDAEYLKTTRIVDNYRASFFPKAGLRLFNILFVEVAPDDIREPEEGGRFFKFNYISFRLLMGFNFYIGAGY